MSGDVKVPGVELRFDGRTYVVPPLNAAAIKQYRDQVATFLTAGAVPDIELVCKLLHAAIVRNYPEVKLYSVEQWVDYGNLIEVMDAVMCTSGLAAAMGKLARRIQAAMDPAPASKPAKQTTATSSTG